MKVNIELDFEEFRAAVNAGAMQALADSLAPLTTERQAVKTATNKNTAEIKKAKAAKDTPPEPQNEPQTNETPAAKTYTLEEVRATLAALTKSGKRDQVRALLGEFGTDKLPEVKQDDYPALMEKAAAL